MSILTNISDSQINLAENHQNMISSKINDDITISKTFTTKFIIHCIKKILKACFTRRNFIYTTSMIFMSLILSWILFLRANNSDIISYIGREEGKDSLIGYFCFSIVLILLELIINSILDFSTLRVFFTALKMSLRDYLGLNWKDFHESTVGDLIIKHYEKSEAVSTLLYKFTCEILTNVLKIFALVIEISSEKNNKELGNTLFISIILYMIIFSCFYKTTNTLYNRSINLKYKSRSLVESETSNFNVIKTYNIEDVSAARIRNIFEKRGSGKLKSHVYRAKVMIFYKIIEISALSFTCMLYYNRKITMTPMDKLLPKINNIYETLRDLMKSISDFNVFFYIYCTLEEQTMKKPTLEKVKIESIDHIECESLSYNGILSNISFSVCKNEKIAIVGPNGSGKTLLLRILTGLVEYEGSIKINGIELRDIQKVNLHQMITFVSQYDAYTLGSVMENLKYGNNLDDKDVIEMCKVFNVDQIFKNLENGYYKHSGSCGKELSGGQRQRISFIRGVLRNTPMLVVDDCLNGVNTKDRSFIVNKLISTYEKTLFMTCGDFNTLHCFDKIILLSNNTAKIGSFNELEDDLRKYFTKST